jgi:hypothetical protein
MAEPLIQFLRLSEFSGRIRPSIRKIIQLLADGIGQLLAEDQGCDRTVNETRNRWLLLFEGILLVFIVTPLLLFPNMNTTLTLGAVCLLVGL